MHKRRDVQQHEQGVRGGDVGYAAFMSGLSYRLYVTVNWALRGGRRGASVVHSGMVDLRLSESAEVGGDWWERSRRGCSCLAIRPGIQFDPTAWTCAFPFIYPAFPSYPASDGLLQHPALFLQAPGPRRGLPSSQSRYSSS